MTKRTALYLRQSKSDDLGIERQLERTSKLAELRGWTIAGEYIDDGQSASKARGAKTAWGRMLRDADAGLFDVVIGVDLDRLLRTTRDLNVLIDHGLQVVTVDGELDLSTADGEFRATMLASIARFEVRRKGERQTRANVQRAAGGGVPKGVRLTGYTTDGRVEPTEAATVRALFDGFAAGETLRGLSATHTLTPSTVRGILTNPRYCGRRLYKGDVVGMGTWKPIVGEGLFDHVNRRLADPARTSNRSGSTARRHLGTSLFRCGECATTDLTLGPTVRTAGSGGRYWCPSCGLVRRADPIDAAVLAALFARGEKPLRSSPAPADTTSLQDEVRVLRGRKTDLSALVADGTLSPADIRTAAAGLESQIAKLETQIAAIVAPAAVAVTDVEVAAGLDKLSLDRRRTLINANMTVHLYRAPRGRRIFDPDSVKIDWKGGEA